MQYPRSQVQGWKQLETPPTTCVHIGAGSSFLRRDIQTTNIKRRHTRGCAKSHTLIVAGALKPNPHEGNFGQINWFMHQLLSNRYIPITHILIGNLSKIGSVRYESSRVYWALASFLIPGSAPRQTGMSHIRTAAPPQSRQRK